MKSFSQFLEESYLSEEESVQGRLLNRKNQAYKDINNPNPGNRGYATDPTPTSASRRLSAGAPEAPKSSPGQLEIPEPKKTTVPGPSVRGETGEPGKLAKRSSTAITPTPTKVKIDTSEAEREAKRSAAKLKQQSAARGTGPSGKPIVTPPPSPKGSGGKPPSGPKFKLPTGAKKALKIGGKVLGPAAAALDVADERSKGSGWLRSLAKGATVAAGGALGGAGGSVAGPVGTVAGATAGSMAASKAFDVVAGANAKERAAMAKANRQSQSGTAVKGIGGKTTFDTKKGTITTGSGSQRKTAQLAKTGVVQRGGQSVAGNLAFKTDSKGQKQAVYKAPPAPGTGSKNPLENVGRALFAGAYKKSDAANAAKKLAVARQSDAARNKALGVKAKPAG